MSFFLLINPSRSLEHHRLTSPISAQPEARHPSERDCSTDKVLVGHNYPISAIAWSPDDSLLLSSAEQQLRLWNTSVRVAFRTPAHSAYIDVHLYR